MLACRNALRHARTTNHATRRRLHVQVDLLDDLKSRGLVSDITRPDILHAEIKRGRQVVYAGVDPTASYLHVGHLLPLLCLLHFQIRGHHIIPLIGGATGLIGDPSGRSTERPLSEASVVERNVKALTGAVHSFFQSALSYARTRFPVSDTPILEPDVRNNLEWLQGLGLLEFLRTVGVHSRVNAMLARESVRARLASQQGISFTEFTYQLLQSYDFLTLHRRAGCTIQIGGSDQWGNIVAGIDLINRTAAGAGPISDAAPETVEKGFGIVTPLLTTASGEKFGKSAGNAIALDERVTSVFDFYQFFVRTPDADVGRYLQMFTLLPLERVDEVMKTHADAPEKRIAQRLLASEVTELVHGKDGLQRALTATAVLYDNDLTSTPAEALIASLRGLPLFHSIPSSDLFALTVPQLAARFKLASSNGAARQLVAAQGLYVNNQPVSAPQQRLTTADLLDGRLVILRAGKQKQAVIAVSDTAL
ncbi:hypothetical protein WOLCODRAFT_138495 [Wolfiporia cocos MD-104 SS10]|uniref:Tyrosine--tRNA ligase n=1 Tax=Wolfiporia cocos (strain MD-104) TaxID=742152 RepID=A0A2H3K3M7_WOLCO|nr:hypothetical protein WOLCODRAFT_138495 [Wolfiporia cocos MD-104 SS10]